jgi:hypothetical protein
MSGRYTPPEETTLGGLVRPSGARSSTRRGTATSTHASALGSGFLGLGVAIIAALQSMIGIALFLLRVDVYPSLLPIAAAWLLLMVTFLGLTITIAANGCPTGCTRSSWPPSPPSSGSTSSRSLRSATWASTPPHRSRPASCCS